MDIDTRAVQIAQTALWLRAQRAWQEMGIEPPQRPTISRSNVIAATAPPPEKDILNAVKDGLSEGDAILLENTLKLLAMVPETGILLRLEQSINAVAVNASLQPRSDLFGNVWQTSSPRLEYAWRQYAESSQVTFRDKIFGKDLFNCLRLINLCRFKFDVVVMNPPFGGMTANSSKSLKKNFENGKSDILCMFVLRGIELLNHTGFIGCISSRTVFFGPKMVKWREELKKISNILIFADFGNGVMDDAMVEAAAYILEKK